MEPRYSHEAWSGRKHPVRLAKAAGVDFNCGNETVDSGIRQDGLGGRVDRKAGFPQPQIGVFDVGRGFQIPLAYDGQRARKQPARFQKKSIAVLEFMKMNKTNALPRRLILARRLLEEQQSECQVELDRLTLCFG